MPFFVTCLGAKLLDQSSRRGGRGEGGKPELSKNAIQFLCKFPKLMIFLDLLHFEEGDMSLMVLKF